MVRPERFELPTCCSGGNRSIQLSYGRTDVGSSLHGNQWFVVSTLYSVLTSQGSVLTSQGSFSGPSGVCGDEPNCACRTDVVKRQQKLRTTAQRPLFNYQRSRRPPPPRPPRSRPPPPPPTRSALGRASLT